MLEKFRVTAGCCPLCMVAQPEVDFREYTTVSPEYVYVNGLFVPVYAFIRIFAKTEVKNCRSDCRTFRKEAFGNRKVRLSNKNIIQFKKRSSQKRSTVL